MNDDHTENAADERSTDLETTLCGDGKHANVRNTLSGSGEVHTVNLNEESCTCKGYRYAGHCYHIDTVLASPLIVSSARTFRSDAPTTVATDGGRSTELNCLADGPELL